MNKFYYNGRWVKDYSKSFANLTKEQIKQIAIKEKDLKGGPTKATQVINKIGLKE